MKVFICWSGQLSKRVGEILHRKLGSMLQGVETFFSPDEIDIGEEWMGKLRHELESTSYGILCLTRENITSPWLHYEAGALTKTVDGHAACLLLGGLQPSDVKAPLSKFQGIDLSQDGLKRLLRSIAKAAGLTKVDPDLIADNFWDGIRKEYDIAQKESPAQQGARPWEEKLGEILDIVREIARKPSAVASSPVTGRMFDLSGVRAPGFDAAIGSPIGTHLAMNEAMTVNQLSLAWYSQMRYPGRPIGRTLSSQAAAAIAQLCPTLGAVHSIVKSSEDAFEAWRQANTATVSTMGAVDLLMAALAMGNEQVAAALAATGVSTPPQ